VQIESTVTGLTRLSRRAFIHQGCLVLAGSTCAGQALAFVADAAPALRIGLVTDLHYADRNPVGSRHYRETLFKLKEAVKQFEREKTEAVVELGDIIDAADSVEAEKGNLARVVQEFIAAPGQQHFVLGNHCVWNLTKTEFLEVVRRKQTYYSFDLGGYHFVILDACFRSDGAPYGRKNYEWTDANIPAAEVEWLGTDLARTKGKVLVFVHQCLDVAPPYGIKNAVEVRKVLEQSGKVLAVFQGHYHRGSYREIGGIHYCTLAAMVEGSGEENNAYAMMDVLPDDSIRVRGFRKQRGYEWP
jgi:predicted phosphohydrolase